jgi:hypothetical protein
MNWIKSILAKVAAFFTSGKAKAALDAAADYTVRALPFIDIAATIVAGLTPTGIDDIALVAVKAKFPRLFNGTIQSGDELKLYALGVATELFKQRYPDLTTSIARTAVQLAYTASTAK